MSDEHARSDVIPELQRLGRSANRALPAGALTALVRRRRRRQLGTGAALLLVLALSVAALMDTSLRFHDGTPPDDAAPAAMTANREHAPSVPPAATNTHAPDPVRQVVQASSANPEGRVSSTTKPPAREPASVSDVRRMLEEYLWELGVTRAVISKRPGIGVDFICTGRPVDGESMRHELEALLAGFDIVDTTIVEGRTERLTLISAQ